MLAHQTVVSPHHTRRGDGGSCKDVTSFGKWLFDTFTSNVGSRKGLVVDSPILCGCDRYETTNHLWLILEYCVGGDLMSLLRQDVRLPESSVHDFGRDMVVALQVRRIGPGGTKHEMVVCWLVNCGVRWHSK